MKKKLAAAAAMVLCLSLLAYGTIAYFTAEDTAVNVITAGNIKIQLQETMIPEDGGEPVAFHGPLESLPGRELSKIVQERIRESIRRMFASPFRRKSYVCKSTRRSPIFLWFL